MNPIAQALYKSGLVPNEYIPMHVEAIERGDYTLAQLLADAPEFYRIEEAYNNV